MKHMNTFCNAVIASIELIGKHVLSLLKNAVLDCHFFQNFISGI